MAELYTTKAKVEKHLLKTIDASHDETIDMWIEAMSINMDKHCNRPLYGGADDNYSDIAYDGNGENLLVIQDCINLQSVTLDGVDMTAEINEYPTTKPHTSRIVLNEGYRFTKGIQNVVVNAVQAMSSGDEPDAAISTACTILVANLVRAQILGEDAGTTEKIGDYSITYPTAYKAEVDTAKSLLSGYRRIAL